jgi:large subunit ribosomal protein L32
MPNPKHRHTRYRQGNRRAHFRVPKPEVGRCPRCSQPVLAHTVCENCGHYKGNEVIYKGE